MKMMIDEKVIDNTIAELVLTNYRVRYNVANDVDTMLISEVASVHVGYRDKKWWLLLVLLGLLSFGSLSEGGDEIGLILGLVLIAIGIFMYLRSRKITLEIVSRGNSKISILVKEMPQKTMMKILETIEAVKINSLNTENKL